MANFIKMLRNSLSIMAVAACAAPAFAAGAPSANAEIIVAQAETEGAKTTTTTTKYGGWTVVCSEGGEPARKACGASYRVVDKKSNSSILVWRIGHNKEGQLLTELVTPTEIRIEPGVSITLDDGKPIRAAYVECTGKSCKARADVSPNIARQLKAAKSVKVDITRLDGQVIQFSMEVPGIDQALADLGV